MAITTVMTTQVTQLYVGLFGRAPDADGLGFWVSKLGNGDSFSSVAQQMFTVDAARKYYPAFLTNQEIVEAFYRKVLGTAPNAEAVDFWLGKLNAKGATPGGVIAEMITAVATYSGSDAQALEAQALLANRVAVGRFYAVTMVGNDIAVAKYILNGVTSDPVTAAHAIAAIESGAIPEMWTPVIQSASYDAATGRLVVTGSGFEDKPGAGNDVIASKLTLSGQDGSHTLTDTANVEVVSFNRFVVTLSATDRAAVAALLNKDGTASTGGVVYNLSAAEDWANFVAATLDVADATGNAVTVTQRAPSGTADYDVTGNGLANNLLGNRGANVIDGKGGDDTLRGGDGNDTYRLDSAFDVVIESSTSGGGTDLVVSSVGYTLGAFVENLKLAGDAFFGIGNELANVLTGSDLGNFLDGQAGADTMRGGLGDDVYCVDQAGDSVIEAEDAAAGRDEVLSSINYVLGAGLENLTLTSEESQPHGGLSGTGNALANVILGNGGDNLLSGEGGRDTLDGGAGRDTLAGGAQADVFRFLSPAQGDRILDFVSGLDRIDLFAIDANVSAAGDQSFDFIGTAAFSANASGQLRVALTTSGMVIYGSTDADATAEFTIRVNGTVLGAADLVL